MTLHAVVVRQPWASLIAHGIKTIETRGFAPKTTVRPGDRLAIVAGSDPKSLVVRSADPDAVMQEQAWMALKAHIAPGLAYVPAPPLGAVVAVVTYFGAWVMEECPPYSSSFDDRWEPTPGGVLYLGGLDGGPWGFDAHGHGPYPFTDQLPLGDFTPGRYGWMLSNPLRLAVPVPCPAVAPDGSRTNMQGVFRLPAAVEAAVVAQIGGES